MENQAPKRQRRVLMREWLDEDEMAIVIDKNGSYKGIVSLDEIVDHDQIPMKVLEVLTFLYGDAFEVTWDRKIQ